jgi:nucleotide-binding universal stress UspA family protein
MATTIAAGSTADRATAHGTARKVLIAMYGQEPPAWARRVSRVVERSGIVRVLVVGDGGAPAFTSLLPPARRWFGAALAAGRREAQDRRQAVLEAVLSELATAAEVVHAPPGRDPARAIAAHANAWPADVVVVGRDRRGLVERALLGSVHAGVVRRARCAVLVVPAPVRRRVPRTARDASLPSRAAAPGGA